MMTKSWTDVFPRKEAPAAPVHSYAPSWFVGEHGGGGGDGSWTVEENKRFEDALAKFDADVPDRWEKVAALIPGKTVGDVMNHYRELVDDVSDIEAGRIPFSVYYGAPSFTLEWESSCDADEWKTPYCAAVKRSGVRGSDHEKKKGVPWTEEEHKLFLLGLKKYGKGDWRNISRNFVLTRTPTQVASHAQKYFIRLNAGSKDKRRSSIHDITTVDLPDNYKPPSPSPQMSSITTQSNLATTPPLSSQFSAILDSDQLGEVASGSNSSSQSVQNKFAVAPFIMKLQPQSSHLVNEIMLSRTSTSSK